MNSAKPGGQGFFARHQLMIEAAELIAILVMPFFLYLAAEARLNIVVTVLLGVMTVLMLAVSRLT